MKTLLYFFLPVVAIAIFAGFVIFDYGSAVSIKGIRDLKVNTALAADHDSASLDGALTSSSLAISSVREHREGHRIVVVVREVPVRSGKDAGTFHLDIPVPKDVSAITFGDSRTVIWHR
jgi:hypothetical protein